MKRKKTSTKRPPDPLTVALAEIARLETALEEARALRLAQEDGLRVARQHETTLEHLARTWRTLRGTEVT